MAEDLQRRLTRGEKRCGKQRPAPGQPRIAVLDRSSRRPALPATPTRVSLFSETTQMALSCAGSAARRSSTATSEARARHGSVEGDSPQPARLSILALGLSGLATV